MPRAFRSSSRPIALAKAAAPSASMVIFPPVPCSLPQAPMTKTSLTAIQAIVSTPLAFIASAFCTKPGRCLALQVGVKAPGTANKTTFLPLKISSVEISFGPSAVATINFMDGIVSPTLIVIELLLPRGFQTYLPWHDRPGLLAFLPKEVTPPQSACWQTFEGAFAKKDSHDKRQLRV